MNAGPSTDPATHAVTSEPSFRSPLAGLMTRQAHFLSFLATRPSLSRAEYQVLAGVSIVTAKKDLAELLRRGLVERIGRGQSTRYVGLGGITPEQYLASCGRSSVYLEEDHAQPDPEFF